MDYQVWRSLHQWASKPVLSTHMCTYSLTDSLGQKYCHCGQFELDLGFDLLEEPPTPVIRPSCVICNRELSAYLDVYYGKDEYEAKKCVGCRK